MWALGNSITDRDKLRLARAGKDCTEIVKKAFEKTLAIAKVGMECDLKMSKLAQENSDAHTGFFLGCFAEQKARNAHLTS